MDDILGIVRNMDNLGRVVLPKEILDSLGLNVKDSFLIRLNNNEIVLTSLLHIKGDAVLSHEELISVKDVIRHIDDLRRVVIPMSIRNKLDIQIYDPLEMIGFRNGQIIIRKFKPIIED